MRPAAADGGPLGGTAAALARRRALLGLVFLAGYVLPLFAPPGPRPLLPPTPDAMLLERLFPGVPAWWVVARLVCLIIGAVLIAGAGDGPVPVHLIRASRHTQSRRSASSRSATVAALLVALAHALMSPQAGQLTQPQQVGYFAMLGVPTALLWLSARWGRFRTASRRSPRRWGLGRTVLPVGAVLLLWCAIRIPAAMHSPRAATPIDFWLNFQWLIELVTQNRNVLTSSSEPGVPNTYMLFVGAPLLGAGRIAPSLTWVQAFHVVWILGTAATLALLVSLVVGRTAAALAAATLLFSPLVLMFHLEPAPLGLLTLLTVALVLLTRQIYIDASVTALAAPPGFADVVDCS